MDDKWKIGPINLNFAIRNYTASGLKIENLKVEERSYYKANKYIRYYTESN